MNRSARQRELNNSQRGIVSSHSLTVKEFVPEILNIGLGSVWIGKQGVWVGGCAQVYRDALIHYIKPTMRSPSYIT